MHWLGNYCSNSSLAAVLSQVLPRSKSSFRSQSRQLLDMPSLDSSGKSTVHRGKKYYVFEIIPEGKGTVLFGRSSNLKGELFAIFLIYLLLPVAKNLIEAIVKTYPLIVKEQFGSLNHAS